MTRDIKAALLPDPPASARNPRHERSRRHHLAHELVEQLSAKKRLAASRSISCSSENPKIQVSSSVARMERYHRLDRKAHAIILSYHYPSRTASAIPCQRISPPSAKTRTSRRRKTDCHHGRREYSVLNPQSRLRLCPLHQLIAHDHKAVVREEFTRQADAYAAARDHQRGSSRALSRRDHPAPTESRLEVATGPDTSRWRWRRDAAKWWGST